MTTEAEDRDPGQRGLRSSVGLACRQFRRAEPGTEAHSLECEPCHSHVVIRESLAGLLRQRPAAPIELLSPELLPAIFERVVTSAEAGVTGALLRQQMPVQPVANSGEAASELLESPLAMALFTRPEQPSAATWESVRGAILLSRGAPPVAVGTSRRRWLGVATVAAAAMVCGILLSDGTRVDPTIVFTDVANVPEVEYVVLRHGIPR